MSKIHKVRLSASKARKFQALKALAKKKQSDAWKKQPRDERGRWVRTGTTLTPDQRRRGAQLAIARLKHKAAKLGVEEKPPVVPDKWSNGPREFMVRASAGGFELIDLETNEVVPVFRREAIDLVFGFMQRSGRITKEQFDLLAGPGDKKSERVKKAENLVKHRHPHMSVDFMGFDDDTAETVAQQFLRLTDEYPTVGRTLRHLGSGLIIPSSDYSFWEEIDIRNGGLDWELYSSAAGLYNPGAQTILLNPYVMGNIKYGNDILKKAEEAKWSVKRRSEFSGIEASLIHEFGHALDRHIDLQPIIGGALKQLKALRLEFFSSLFSIPEEVVSEISNYAAMHHFETFAEAFLAAKAGLDPLHNNPVMQKMRKLLDYYRDNKEIIDWEAQAGDILRGS